MATVPIRRPRLLSSAQAQRNMPTVMTIGFTICSRGAQAYHGKSSKQLSTPPDAQLRIDTAAKQGTLRS